MTRRTPDPGWLPLLERILADRPNLPNAKCIGRPGPFDVLIDHHVAGRHHGTDTTTPGYRAAYLEAARICSTCPETACPDRTTDSQEKSA